MTGDELDLGPSMTGNVDATPGTAEADVKYRRVDSGITIQIGDDQILPRDDERCPGCNHWLSNHAQGLGCQVGWKYALEGGPALGPDGCECLLTHVEISPTERDHWGHAKLHYAPPQGVPPITDHELRKVSNQIRQPHYNTGRREGDQE